MKNTVWIVFAILVLSPGGSVLAAADALVAERAGNIWIMNTDGTGAAQITTGGGASMPRLSNGTVTFKRNGRLYRTTTAGASPTAIPNTDNVWEYDLDPTGTKIVIAHQDNFVLHTMNLDGSGKAAINSEPGIHQVAPNWGRNGYIYFVRATYGDPYTQKVNRIPEGGTNNRQQIVTDFSQVPVEGGTSGKIAFNVNQPAPRIRIANADGTGQVDVPNVQSGIGYGISFDYTRDVLYYEYQRDLWSIRTDGSSRTRLTTSGDFSPPDYGSTGGTSAAGTGYIVYERTGNIWYSTPDGATSTQITTGGGASWPRLSSAIVTFKRNNRLYRTTLSGASPQAIPNTENVYEYDLDPTGTKIVIAHQDNFVLYTMNIDGSGKTAINNEPGVHQVAPRWARNGYIYFVRATFGNPFTQKINRIPAAGGSSPQQIVDYFSQVPAQGGTQGKIIFNFNQPAPMIRLANADGTAESTIPNVQSGVGYGIAFDETRDVVYYEYAGDLWSIRTDGTDRRRLTTSGDVAAPVDFGTAPRSVGASLTATSACTGATSTLTVSLTGITGARAFEFDIEFPSSAVSAGAPATTALTNGFSLSSNQTAGRLRVALASASPVSGDGAIATIPLSVIGLSPGASSTISLTNLKVDDAVHPGAQTSLTCTVACTKGDVNANGSVSALDASLVLQSVVGSITLDATQRCAADYNSNGTVSALDASEILQCVVGSGTCR